LFMLMNFVHPPLIDGAYRVPSISVNVI
jgi:hypothetical protein